MNYFTNYIFQSCAYEPTDSYTPYGLPLWFMNEESAENQNFIRIGEASKLLGVSSDTLRRWANAGKITTLRLDGKNRYFSIPELQLYKASQTLSTLQAATELGVSTSTVRRLEGQLLLVPQRDSNNGRRMYGKEQVVACRRYMNQVQLYVV
jgi:excisionase family DNA binding protein